MAKRRSHGDGTIDQRGENSFRIRYRVGKQRFTKTFRGTYAEAKKKLRDLINSVDTGKHVAPSKDTLAEWAKHWIEIGAPGRRRQANGARAVERYDQLLRTHVLPTLGDTKLQGLQPADIDKLYLALEGKMAPRTARHVHSVLNACLAAAVRTGKLAVNPTDRINKAPSPGESDHGIALDDEQLGKLIQGFAGSALFPIVSVAAFTGARRNEILAPRWSDLNTEKKELRIERAIEETEKHGIRTKGPKKESHKRTITIDDDLLALLLVEREKHLRIKAGVPAGASVDLSLVRLPDDALMFPNPPALADLKFSTPRGPRAVTKEFARKAKKLGFKKLRLHDLRGTHETLLLDRGVPVHVVAARCGHDPAVLLRNYAKRTAKADTNAAAVIGSLTKGILGN
jgi:integrase